MNNSPANDNVPETLSTKLVTYRKERSWSQAQLAEALNVSQPTVSRLETCDDHLPATRLLMGIAGLLSCAVTDLVPADKPVAAKPKEIFMAFCPNALCKRNIPMRMPDGKADISWKSALTYQVVDFNKIVFCAFCKTKVVKACLSCGMAIGHAGAPYCRGCGAEVFAWPPTGKEWRAVERRLADWEAEDERRREEDW